MRPRRSTAAARVTQPRATATINAITANPDPPTVTHASTAGVLPDVRRSNARPLSGCAPSQKYRKSCRCTASSSASSGNDASAAGSDSAARVVVAELARAALAPAATFRDLGFFFAPDAAGLDPFDFGK
jgi:hypothetical protein